MVKWMTLVNLFSCNPECNSGGEKMQGWLALSKTLAQEYYIAQHGSMSSV